MTDLIGTDHPLTQAQRSVLQRCVDLMIPASDDGVMPAAAELGLYDDVSDLDEAVVEGFRAALDDLAEMAAADHQQAFSALERPAAMVLVDRCRGHHPGFYRSFVVNTAARYYQHDRVVVALGLQARPPWPQGNEIIEGDWSLLDPVRARSSFYR